MGFTRNFLSLLGREAGLRQVGAVGSGLAGGPATPKRESPESDSSSSSQPNSSSYSKSSSEPGRGSSYLDLFSYGVENTAMTVATVYCCVEFLSESVANLPLLYQRLRDDVFEEDRNSPLHYLLTVQPEPSRSAFSFWKEVVQNMLLKGNAYIVPVYNPVTLELERLALCAPGCVNHDVYNNTYTVNDTLNRVTGTFGEQDIIHLMLHTRDGKNGMSVLQYARQSVAVATSGDTETLDRFRNGGAVRGFVTNERSVHGYGRVQDDELSGAAGDIDGKFRSGNRIVSLPGDVDFKQISLSSTDMQFLESRKFTVLDICRFFRVHPSFVFSDTSNNYKSAEMADVAFKSSTLNPLLRNIENELHRKLVPRSLCCKRRFRFDRNELYACDLEGKSKYQQGTIASGIMTVNDWRRRENMPTVEGGDKVLVSANLKSITELGMQTQNPNSYNSQL